MKKKVFLVLKIGIVVVALLLVNVFWGNPISKRNAEKEAVQHYEDAYKEKFTVYTSKYNPLLRGYVIEMGPTSHENLRFATGLYFQGITDEYGGILAASKLSQDVAAILQPDYGYLNYEIRASEEPLAAYAGENPDYFDADPVSRVQKNHYNLVIAAADGVVSQAELDELAIAMVKKIEMDLPYQTPNLRIYTQFKTQAGSADPENKSEGRDFQELFLTTP